MKNSMATMHSNQAAAEAMVLKNHLWEKETRLRLTTAPLRAQTPAPAVPMVWGAQAAQVTQEKSLSEPMA